MRAPVTYLDRYVFRQTIGTFLSVIGIVMSIMVLEHLPRLIEITRLSGHRGYIVAQSVAGLLPEYIGIGLVVGLYLAVALTVRRIALRGELEAIQAIGVSPWRWMRMPLLLALAAAGLCLVNQGWIMPAGEARLERIGQRMAIGDFGYNLTAGQFVDLGNGNVLTFQAVEPATGYLQGIFLKAEERTFSALRGRLSIAPDGEAIIDLIDGQAVQSGEGQVLSFRNIRYRTRKPGVADDTRRTATDDLQLKPLDALLASGTARDRATALARLLWPLLALVIPVLAFVFGKPPRRGNGAVGIIVGLTLLVLFLKMISLLGDLQSETPEKLALAIALGWGAIAVILLKMEATIGQGFVDRLVLKLLGRQ